MATKRIISDKEFGKIIIRTHRLARNISMRVKPDGLYLTVPPYSKTEYVMEVIGQYRFRLLESYKKIEKPRINFDFSIQTECFRLTLEPGKVHCFTVRQTDDGMKIYCPSDTDFSNEGVQKLVRSAIVRAMKRSAEAYLPELLKMWSDRVGLPYKKVRINAARSRWGSCTASRTINLSCYLMLVPAHLMDYVILHELAHTREMNHGPQFWELLNDMTDGLALQLRKELRNYHTAF